MAPANAQDNFSISLLEPLVRGEKIYVIDTCTGLVSAVAIVPLGAVAPLLSPTGLVLAVALLGLIGLLSLGLVRKPGVQ